MSALGLGWLVAAVLAQAAPAIPPPAGPAPAVSVAVEAAGTCPTGEAVGAALLPVLAGAPAAAALPAPHVSDLGPRFEVVAAGQTGVFVDAARDCVERARVAAVFIALALNPPAAPVRPPPPAPPALAPRVTNVAPVGRWLSAALAARFDAAEMGSPGGVDGTWGGELRIAFGQGALGIAVSAGLLAPTVSSFGSVAVREQRFPFGAVVSLGRELPRGLRLDGELGLAVVPFTLRGQGLDTVVPATRLDVGARLGVELRFPLLAGHLAPLVGLHAEYFPRDYAFVVDPLGDVGTSSHLWLGASLGAAFEVDRRR